MPTDVVIEVSGLRMSYDGFEAVRGIDLQVSRGEIFTFLGPNGAGKTTTVEILEGHRKRTAGDVRCSARTPSTPIAGGARGLAWCSRPRASSRSSRCESVWSSTPGTTRRRAPVRR